VRPLFRLTAAISVQAALKALPITLRASGPKELVLMSSALGNEGDELRAGR
jgi:hypothetical protein